MGRSAGLSGGNCWRLIFLRRIVQRWKSGFLWQQRVGEKMDERFTESNCRHHVGGDCQRLCIAFERNEPSFNRPSWWLLRRLSLINDFLFAPNLSDKVCSCASRSKIRSVGANYFPAFSHSIRPERWTKFYIISPAASKVVAFVAYWGRHFRASTPATTIIGWWIDPTRSLRPLLNSRLGDCTNPPVALRAQQRNEQAFSVQSVTW